MSAPTTATTAGVTFLLDTIKALEKRTSCLLEVARFVRELHDFHDLLSRILAKSVELVGADAGVIALAHKDSGEFEFVNVHYASLPALESEKKEKMLHLIRLKLSDGIIGEVYASGEPKIVTDLAHSSIFRKDVSETVQYEVRNLMAVPLSIDGERLGVVEFLNKTPEGSFAALDVDLASAVANQMALVVEAHRLRETAGVKGAAAGTDGEAGLEKEGWEKRLKEAESRLGEREKELMSLRKDLSEARKASEGAEASSRKDREEEIQRARSDADEKVLRLTEDLETAFRLQEKTGRQIEELSRALEDKKRNESRPREHQAALMKAFSAVSSSQSTDFVLDQLLNAVVTILDSEAASLLLTDEESGQLYFAAATGGKKDPLKKVLLKEGEGIAGWVAKNGRILNIPDVARDPRFSDQADKSADFKTLSVLAVPLFSESRLIGVAEAVNKRGSGPFSEDDGQTLIALSLYGAMAIRKAQIYWDMNDLFLSTVRALADAMEVKGPGAKGCSERVRLLTLALGAELGVPSRQERDMELAALLHNVGKVVVPENLLHRTEDLTEEEARLLARTPVVAAEILSAAKPLRNVVPFVRHVHERWDGQGYPDRLKGEDIPLGSRVIAVAAAYEAMTADRPHHRRLPEELAMKEVQSLRGVHLDPSVVDALVRLYRKGKLKDLFK